MKPHLSKKKCSPGSSRLSRAALRTLAAAALALGLIGCPDPIGQFDEFTEKLANKPHGPAGDCGPETVQTVEGTFFLALSTQLAPEEPVVMLAEVTTGAEGMSMIWQPLRADDRTTPVGEPIEVPPAPIDSEGKFTSVATGVVVDSAANPVMTVPIEAPSITLEGTACHELLCGGMSGQLTKPLTVTLLSDQSKFTLERVEPGEDYPEPPQISCLGELATPVGEL